MCSYKDVSVWNKKASRHNKPNIRVNKAKGPDSALRGLHATPPHLDVNLGLPRTQACRPFSYARLYADSMVHHDRDVVLSYDTVGDRFFLPRCWQSSGGFQPSQPSPFPHSPSSKKMTSSESSFSAQIVSPNTSRQYGTFTSMADGSITILPSSMV